MRSMLRAACLAAAATTTMAGAAVAQGAPKLAYVNTQAIMAQAPGRAEAEKRFEGELTANRDQAKRMSDSLNAMITDFGKAEPTMTAADKEARTKLIRDKQAEYQQRVSRMEEDAQKRQMEFFQPLMQQVERILADIRREDGYAMIFDVGAQGAPIVAADTTLDITQKVIARLKAAPAPAAPARPASVGPVAQPSGMSTRPKTP